MARIGKGDRWVQCTNCSLPFQTKKTGLNIQCGGCGKRGVRDISLDTDLGDIEFRGKGQLPLNMWSIPADFDLQAKVQTLMNTGLGKNYQDVIQKSIDNMLILRSGLIKGGKNVTNTEDTLDEIKKRELLDAEKNRIEADTEAKKKEAGPMQKITKLSEDDLERRMAEAQIKRLEAGNQSPLEQMMMMEYFKSSRGAKEGNPEIEELKRKLETLEQERRFDDIRKSNEELKSMVMDVLKSKTGETQEGLITKMTQIFADRDKDMARLQQEIQSAKDETRQAQLDAKLDRIQDRFQQLQGGKSELAQFKETFGTVKELAQEFGGKKEEKSGAQIAQELITSTIDKISEPVLKPIGMALADKARGQPQMPVQIQTIPQQSAIEQVQAPQATNPEEAKEIDEYPDIVQVSKT